jgi:hypothetical protein
MINLPDLQGATLLENADIPVFTLLAYEGL